MTTLLIEYIRSEKTYYDGQLCGSLSPEIFDRKLHLNKYLK
jgi:hypothetical protein